MTMLPDMAIVNLMSRQSGMPTVYVPSDRIDRYGDIKPQQIQPASLDVRLYHEFISYESGGTYPGQIWPDGLLIIEPGACVLASIVERLDMRADNLAARVEGKSSWARQFLTVHSAGFIDPGFRGDITLELKNDGPRSIKLPAGVVIAQLSFHLLSAPATRLYGEAGLGSHYQGQMGPTEALT